MDKYYDEPFDRAKYENAQKAREAVNKFRSERLNKAFDAKQAQSAAQKSTPRPGAFSAAKNAASKVGNFLTRPRSAMAGAKAVGGLAVRGGSKLFGLPGVAIAGAAYAGDALKDTKTAQAMQRPITDGLARITGTDDLQARMLSNDPAVSRAAIAEQRAASPPVTRPSAAPEAVAPTVAETPATGPNSQEIDTNLAVLVNGQPSGEQVSAKRPTAIPNTDYAYAGQVGNTQAITRPTMGPDGKPLMVDREGNPATAEQGGKEVPLFTDTFTEFNRPAPPQSAEAIAAEQARVAQAREDYAANTTGSDGRRFYGGPATEKLREAQMDAVKSGDSRNIRQVERQLADEGRTPEQRAAYAADPAAAYGVDAQANAASAKAQMDAFKMQYDMARDAVAGRRAESTEARRARSAAIAEAQLLLKPLEDPAPEAASALLRMATEQYDPASGETMSQVIDRIMQGIELDGGLPMIENGQLVMKPTAAQEQPSLG